MSIYIVCGWDGGEMFIICATTDVKLAIEVAKDKKAECVMVMEDGDVYENGHIPKLGGPK